MREPTPDAYAVRAWAAHLGAPVADPARLRAELAAGTLTEAFHATARRRPRAPALQVGDESVTHGELDARAARMGGVLRAHGVAPGDRVLVAGRSSVALVVAYLGLLRARAAMVPADPGATATELRQAMEAAGAVTALADPEPRERLGAGLALDPGGDAEPLAPHSEPGDLVMLAFTSGTTGRPKGVPLSHGNLLASLRAAARAWRWREDDVLVHALPLSHQHGLTGVQLGLLTGSRARLLPRFDPEALAAALTGASVLFAVPAMYERLVEHLEPGSLRLAVSGSAPLPPALAERVAAALGFAPLERYGSTEAGLCVSQLVDGERRPGTVGFPLPGLELAILEEDEIALRGPQVFGGYWDDPEATAESFTPGGWFRTGDAGRLGAAGLEITGRLKELIVSGGLNVYPREVELALEEHPGVARAAVVGVPSERWGEEVVAFVVGEAGGLDAHLRERLSAHKVPKRVLVVDDLPVSDTGKVRRADLVEMATAEEATT